MFISKLQNNFGPHDPEGEAEASLENLCMCKNRQITKYIVEFNQLAACVQWGDTSLRCQLYNGFRSWIKDEISKAGKPDDLTDLYILTQSIDARYWECCNKIAHETLANKTQDKSNDKGKTPTMANQNSSNKNPPNSGTSGNTPTPTALASTPKLAATLVPKFGKDGRLTWKDR